MKCDHVFKGHADGVTCMRCGLRMTTDEYMAYLGTPEEPKEEPEGNSVKEPEPEEPKEPVKEEPEAPKKPERARKPKEEPEHE